MQTQVAAQQQTSTPIENQSTFRITRRLARADQSVWDTVTWAPRTAAIRDDAGGTVFEQTNIEAPEHWSQLAINVVASKYFYGDVGTSERETSIRELIDRVARTVTEWGVAGEYFISTTEAVVFRDELTYLLLHQMMAFNSPVWFNVGVRDHPQCSACFIQSVDDDMGSIMDLARSEVMLFKYGSGTGSNLSNIRGSTEPLSGGGRASGPVSFMRGFDAFAGVVKSGGRTRRAAKMIALDCDHPDIMEFVTCKVREEQKACDLVSLGYSDDLDGEAYSSVFFQNANHSVRITDQFMRAVCDNQTYDTKRRVDGEVHDTLDASDMLMEIARATHRCGDPGIQFDDTINTWHTCKQSGRINASNPCSEYMFLDDSACNLASLNLMKFVDDEGVFQTDLFKHAVGVAIMAQEIIVDNSSYPTEQIARNSQQYRPLGLGYANLGALLMACGLPYDSDDGRSLAGAVTSIMCGHAYTVSAHLARRKGPFDTYTDNIESTMNVIRMHRDHAYKLTNTDAHNVWDDALQVGTDHGFRNAQTTVLAPTGTIAFMMDCDTTGIEPDIALIKYKRLVGGGMLEIVNQTVPLALKRLGYDESDVTDIVAYVRRHGTIEGAPHLKDEHLPVFDCAIKPQNGTRSIEPMGHIKMMAACQPFLSGAISKTVNVPESATPEEIYEMYVQSWWLGLKAIAVYRDGSKRSQPLATDKDTQTQVSTSVPARKRLPVDREAVTHKFSIAGHEGYVTAGFYEDGTIGEIFVHMAKEGSTVSGLVDTVATLTSVALQYGVPVNDLVAKFGHVRFEPSGFTGNSDIPTATSITDYIFRWLGIQQQRRSKANPASIDVSTDAPPCLTCGALTQRAGTCYVCTTCGSATGCG